MCCCSTEGTCPTAKSYERNQLQWLSSELWNAPHEMRFLVPSLPTIPDVLTFLTVLWIHLAKEKTTSNQLNGSSSWIFDRILNPPPPDIYQSAATGRIKWLFRADAPSLPPTQWRWDPTHHRDHCTGRFFYRFPHHCTCHGVSQLTQAFHTKRCPVRCGDKIPCVIRLREIGISGDRGFDMILYLGLLCLTKGSDALTTHLSSETGTRFHWE